MKSPVLLLQALLKDLEAHDCGIKGLKRDFHTLERRYENEGYSFLSVTLPSLGKSVLTGLSNGCFVCPSSFKKRYALPVFLRGLLSKIFDAKTGRLLSDHGTDLVEFIYQITMTFKKVQLSPSNEEQLVKKALTEFVSWDNSLKDVSEIRKDFFRVFTDVCDISLKTLSKFDSRSFRGKHGPGSVYEKLLPNEKWKYTFLSSLSDDRLDHLCYTENYPDLGVQSDLNIDLRSTCARVVHVPKNSTSVRLITVEPYLNQFIQGGLKEYLWSSIRDMPISGCLALDRQELNQNLALVGSIYQSHCTIDLKSASDSLSNDLVHSVFSRYEDFFRVLMSCRTPYVRVDNRLHLLRKYAGMGNATTFPIQSIIYALIGISCILWSEGLRPSDRNIRAVAPRLRVYGDDIIIRTKYAKSQLTWLTEFGFTVNLDKSFLYGNFRESCGVDAYKGVIITPTYVRHYPSIAKKRADPRVITNMVSCSNQFFDRALYHTAHFLKEQVEGILGPLPLVTRESRLLGWFTRSNAYTFSKWCTTYHRFKHRGYVVRVAKQRDPLDGYPALLKFYHMDSRLYGAVNERHLEESDVRRKTNVSLSWCHV